ncbi:MAG: hypothetical protein PHN64_06820 [Desulfovibrionaceae bacterium]|nr:hypothetical protein [Desulfovibrionaceae bacterium]
MENATMLSAPNPEAYAAQGTQGIQSAAPASTAPAPAGDAAPKAESENNSTQQSQQEAEQALSAARERIAQENTAAWQAQVAQWRTEAETDPELGGAALPTTVARAQMALQHFDSEDHFVGKLLQESGYGNHPQVLRFFSRLASSLMEDSLSTGDAAQRSSLPLEERLYAQWQQ